MKQYLSRSGFGKQMLWAAVLILSTAVIAGCEDSDKRKAETTTVLPLDLAPLKMNYQRDYIHQQWGLPPISRKAPISLGEKLHYERYPLDGGEIQLFFKKDELWAYILRNYQADKPAIEHWQQWWANDPAWTFGKDNFKGLKHNVTADKAFSNGRHRCRIDSAYFGAAGKYHHYYFASSEPEARDKTKVNVQLETVSEKPLCELLPEGDMRATCTEQWHEVICAPGEETLG